MPEANTEKFVKISIKSGIESEKLEIYLLLTLNVSKNGQSGRLEC